jgi:hypothetical protein
MGCYRIKQESAVVLQVPPLVRTAVVRMEGCSPLPSFSYVHRSTKGLYKAEFRWRQLRQSYP